MNLFRTGKYGGLAASAMLVFAACEGTAPTAPVGSGLEAPVQEFQPQFVSSVPTTVVTAVPQARPFPGTKVQGEASVCKDPSSPTGSYTFNVSATGRQTGDLLASSVTLTPGHCSIVYSRNPTTGDRFAVTSVTITEVVPSGARLDRVVTDDDASGPRTLAGPTVTLLVNGFHGGFANYFNAASAPQSAIVDLRTASTYGILAGTTVTCVSGGIVGGDIGISPGNALTGFGPCANTGVQNLGNPAAAQAQLDLTAAYNALAGLPCPPANVIAADIGGTTKAAGVYCSASSIGITGTLTLDGGGDVNSSFVFQAGSTLTTAGSIVLINGAQARNVFFQVGSSATIGTGSQIQGNIVALSSITLNNAVTLTGRALALHGAVTLGTGVIITLP